MYLSILQKYKVGYNIKTNMQVGHLKNVNYIEKILRDKEGRLVRAKFSIYESEGRIKARLVDFVYLTEKVVSKTVYFLSGFSKTKATPMSDIGDKLISSPFITSEILYSTGSKPRAPTFV